MPLRPDLRRGPAAAVVRQRLLGGDRRPRGGILGAGRRPQPRGRLWRPTRHRLGRPADARVLHRLHPGRARFDLDPFLAYAAGGRGRGAGRGRRRPAGPAPAHLLLRHDHAGFCHHRHPGRAGLAERHRRRHRPVRSRPVAAVRQRLGFLPAVPGLRRRRHLDDRQRRRQPLRPLAGRHPRRRGRRRSHRHLQSPPADHWSSCSPASPPASPAGCSPRCSPTSRPRRSASTCRSPSSSPSWSAAAARSSAR